LNAGSRPPRIAPTRLDWGRRADHLRNVRIHEIPVRRQPRRHRLAVLTLVAGLVLAACGGGGDDDAAEATDDTAAPSSTTTAAPAATDPACTAAPIEHRAGLLLIVGLPDVTEPDDPLVSRLAEIGVGGVILHDDNLQSLEQSQRLVAGLRERIGEHLLVAIDEEGGRVSSLRALGGSTPSARRLGAAGPEAAAQAGADMGALLSSVGIDLLFAPVLDLDGGPANGVVGDRSFGTDPQAVAATAGAFAQAVRDAGVAVTIKHFPGHGGEGDPHLDITTDERSKDELVATDVVPFDALIDQGAEAVMVGHVAYPQIWGPLPASLEPGAYQMLRDSGFEGMAVTDALGMGGVYNRWGFDVAPAIAIAAGADAVLVNQGDRVDELLGSLFGAVQRGELPEARIDEAARRVLALQGRDPAGIVCPAG
jgi:beta-N-acetylhexosaminidase